MTAKRQIALQTLEGLRKKRGIQQREVAERLDVRAPSVSRYESGSDPRLSTLDSYIAALGGALVLIAVFQETDGRITRLKTRKSIGFAVATFGLGSSDIVTTFCLGRPMSRRHYFLPPSCEDNGIVFYEAFDCFEFRADAIGRMVSDVLDQGFELAPLGASRLRCQPIQI